MHVWYKILRKRKRGMNMILEYVKSKTTSILSKEEGEKDEEKMHVWYRRWRKRKRRLMMLVYV